MPAHPSVSRFSTKGIVRGESPGHESHQPTDKGEDSTLDGSRKGFVPNDRVHI